MAGIHNEILYGANMDFRGVWPPVGQIVSNGQIFIGASVAPFLRAGTLASADSSVTWTFGAGTIDASVQVQNVFPWTDQGTSITVSANHGYFVTAAITLTLPASPSQGQRVAFVVDTTSSFVIQANTGQSIRVASQLSSVAGTLTNAARGDSISLVYRSTGALWVAENNPCGAWVAA